MLGELGLGVMDGVAFEHVVALVVMAVQDGEGFEHAGVALAQHGGRSAQAVLQAILAAGAGLVIGADVEILDVNVDDSVGERGGKIVRSLAGKDGVAQVKHHAGGAVEGLQEAAEALNAVDDEALILVHALNAQRGGVIINLTHAGNQLFQRILVGGEPRVGIQLAVQRVVQNRDAGFLGAFGIAHQRFGCLLTLFAAQIAGRGQAGQRHIVLFRFLAHTAGNGGVGRGKVLARIELKAIKSQRTDVSGAFHIGGLLVMQREKTDSGNRAHISFLPGITLLPAASPAAPWLTKYRGSAHRR